MQSVYSHKKSFQQGVKGDRGMTGMKGDKGDRGFDGANGSKGEKGVRGGAGPTVRLYISTFLNGKLLTDIYSNNANYKTAKIL